MRAYFDEPRAAVRRKDRAVDDEAWIRALLRTAPMGTLATVCDGQPFINTNIFAYDEAAHVIYMHTARAGRTRANVDDDERVCFSVARMGRLLPAATALEMSVEYDGVVVFGSACVVAAGDDQRHGLQLLLDKYFTHLRPGRDYREIQDDELVRTSVYRIAIEEWSGKRKQVDADFAGAFVYDEGERT
jgi:nitroimidazol reductase NimA-like FMN-containing flavoprotein (pyridoxamine 5'-phosphate oxidase superfamily)